MEKKPFSGEFEQKDKWKMGLLKADNCEYLPVVYCIFYSKADNCEYLMAAIYSVTVGITVQSKVILP